MSVLAVGVPLGAAAAMDAHARGLVAVRGQAVAAVDSLVHSIATDRFGDTYAAAEPAAVAKLRQVWTVAAVDAVRTATGAAQAWGRGEAALSVVPEVPAGLVPDVAGTVAQLRLTVLIEARQRVASGVQPQQALEHARLRAGRAAAGIGTRAARTAHEETLEKVGLGWARVPVAQGCPWCLLLASRGPVYRSERTAQGKVGPYHPWCRCRTVAVPRRTPIGDYLAADSDVGQMVQAAADAYDQAGSKDKYLAGGFAQAQERARRGRTAAAASGGGGKPPRPSYGVGADGEPLWPSGGAVPTPADLRARELVGVGWEYFNTPEKIRSGVAAKEVAIAEWIEASYGVRVISVDEDPREFARTPDALWGAGTVEFKTLDRPTLNAMKQNLRDAGTKSRNAVLDLRVVTLSRAQALALAAGLDRRYLDRLDGVLLVGGDWHHWLKGGSA